MAFRDVTLVKVYHRNKEAARAAIKKDFSNRGFEREKDTVR